MASTQWNGEIRLILSETIIRIPRDRGCRDALSSLREHVARQLKPEQWPLRLAVTQTTETEYICELGVLQGTPDGEKAPIPGSIFDFHRRPIERTEKFNCVMVIPTGVGAELGGHSGDAGSAACLLASACDTLITHPNVVNAADINELPENGMYVEGSILARLLCGTAGLSAVRSNRVLMVLDEHPDPFFHEAAINSVSAARAAMGLHCPLVITMQNPLLMRAFFTESGRATGDIEFMDSMFEVLDQHAGQFDAVAISSQIQVADHFHKAYFEGDAYDMVNPWGGVEAMLTHAISMRYNLPSAHSPMMCNREVMDLDVGVVDPRKSAEAVSTTYLHCILKGLHRSPKIVNIEGDHPDPSILTAADVSCLVIPDGCLGLPVFAAMQQGIPVIAVKNENCMNNRLEELPFQPGTLFKAENYLEAVGWMTAIKAGLAADSLLRPIPMTEVRSSSGALESTPVVSARRLS